MVLIQSPMSFQVTITRVGGVELQNRERARESAQEGEKEIAVMSMSASCILYLSLSSIQAMYLHSISSSSLQFGPYNQSPHPLVYLASIYSPQSHAVYICLIPYLSTGTDVRWASIEYMWLPSMGYCKLPTYSIAVGRIAQQCKLCSTNQVESIKEGLT